MHLLGEFSSGEWYSVFASAQATTKGLFRYEGIPDVWLNFFNLYRADWQTKLLDEWVASKNVVTLCEFSLFMIISYTSYFFLPSSLNHSETLLLIVKLSIRLVLHSKIISTWYQLHLQHPHEEFCLQQNLKQHKISLSSQKKQWKLYIQNMLLCIWMHAVCKWNISPFSSFICLSL